eukprot:12129549-Alexandrium_andersonii.AAC.1
MPPGLSFEAAHICVLVCCQCFMPLINLAELAMLRCRDTDARDPMKALQPTLASICLVLEAPSATLHELGQLVEAHS